MSKPTPDSEEYDEWLWRITMDAKNNSEQVRGVVKKLRDLHSKFLRHQETLQRARLTIKKEPIMHQNHLRNQKDVANQIMALDEEFAKLRVQPPDDPRVVRWNRKERTRLEKCADVMKQVSAQGISAQEQQKIREHEPLAEKARGMLFAGAALLEKMWAEGRSLEEALQLCLQGSSAQEEAFLNAFVQQIW